MLGVQRVNRHVRVVFAARENAEHAQRVKRRARLSRCSRNCDVLLILDDQLLALRLFHFYVKSASALRVVIVHCERRRSERLRSLQNRARVVIQRRSARERKRDVHNFLGSVYIHARISTLRAINERRIDLASEQHASDALMSDALANVSERLSDVARRVFRFRRFESDARVERGVKSGDVVSDFSHVRYSHESVKIDCAFFLASRFDQRKRKMSWRSAKKMLRCNIF
jgi:hypothetical protein